MSESKPVDNQALEQIFLQGRTYSNWQARPVPDELLQRLYELVKLGPTAANCCPARFVFVRTPEAKARLLPAMADGNQEKTRTAPVTVIVAYDLEFYEKLPQLFPYVDARSWYVGNEAFIQESAMRNGSLQGGYLLLAARALGLDCGPMSGFDADKVNAEFFPDSKWRANFIVNLGYGDPSKLHPRAPRLAFEESCHLL